MLVGLEGPDKRVKVHVTVRGVQVRLELAGQEINLDWLLLGAEVLEGELEGGWFHFEVNYCGNKFIHSRMFK
jgi:hypothetical protein